jgi:hypothetical protein
VGLTDVHEAISMMRSQPDLLTSVGRCPEELIRRAEHELGQPFPPSYRCFLAELGAASFNGNEFYGLIPHDFEGIGVPNALWLHRTHIAQFAQPARYFEFFDYGDGTTVALDLGSRHASGECALAETHAGGWAECVDDVDGDFGSFLLARVRARLDAASR